MILAKVTFTTTKKAILVSQKEILAKEKWSLSLKKLKSDLD